MLKKCIHRGSGVLAAMIALGAIGLPALGQSATPIAPPTAPQPTKPISTPKAAASRSGPATGHNRLIREGSHLIQIRGTMRGDEGGSSWVFVIDQAHPTLPGCELSVLPCTKLGEMQRMVEMTQTQKVLFEASGQVFAYRGRNYFLPVHAALVAVHAPPAAQPVSGPDSAVGTAETSPTQTDDEQTTASKTEDDDSAEAIAAELDRAVGPVTKSLDTGQKEKADERVAGKSRPVVKEDAMILSRRGRMTRDAGGSWTFVFDADAAGLADPPMTLLPCLLLERMESYAGTSESGALMLLSGRVLTYHERNYLLPTVYQIPRERTPIKP